MHCGQLRCHVIDVPPTRAVARHMTLTRAVDVMGADTYDSSIAVHGLSISQIKTVWL
jgi:hypothetical protein